MRYPTARLVVVFQPHTFTRTQALLEDFAAAWHKADRALVTEIFAAREQNPSGFSSRAIVERMKQSLGEFVESLALARVKLQNELRLR